MQVFSPPTYDRIAKHILCNDESVRIDILKAFTGIRSLCSAVQLDEHYNPFDPLLKLRKLVNSPAFQSLFETVKVSAAIEVSLDGKPKPQAFDLLKSLSFLYGDLTHAFPSHKYRSTVDFLCETDFGYITVEFQVIKQDYWDRRALAYIAGIFGNQLRPGQDYDHLQNVIGINLLGDGSTPYWNDGNFVRDYTFVDQKGSGHKIPELRLIQYSLGDVDAALSHKDLKNNEPLRKWIEFFKFAHEKEAMPPSIDEPVRKAYEMIRVDVLKKEHPDLLYAAEKLFANVTEHDQAVREKTQKEELEKVARKMLAAGKTVAEIMEMTGLSLEQVEKSRLKDR